MILEVVGSSPMVSRILLITFKVYFEWYFTFVISTIAQRALKERKEKEKEKHQATRPASHVSAQLRCTDSTVLFEEANMKVEDRE